jgi:hypothetical protein
MKTIRFLLWFAIIVTWAVASTLYPESDNTARTVAFICGAIVEIVYRIKKQTPDDTPVTPEPIQSLNLTKRP